MAFFLPAVLGGTGGWMPLLATSFLIGSWLLFPRADEQNEIFDPGAEEMPRVNQALRGVTLSVLFGTNRVSSNITWTKNWNVIRHETAGTGGGGKGGGSGGSKMPEQPGSVSYTYTWDIMLTCGMVPATYSLYGGWVNQQRMNDDTIASIAQDLALLDFSAISTVPDEATLEFAEAFYSGGAPTTETTVDNWDYWETQEGYPCRWPHVVWLGFKTLNLGNTAALPTLEWEVGPGKAEITLETAFIDQISLGSAGDVFYPYLGEFVRGDDSEKYIMAWEGTGLKILRFQDPGGFTLTETLTSTDIDAAVTTLGLDSDLQSGSRYGGSMIMGTDKYFLTYSQGNTTNLHTVSALIVWKINSAGSAEPVGAFAAVQGPSFGTGFMPERIGSAVSLANNQDLTDPILIFTLDNVSASQFPNMVVTPPLLQMLIPSEGGTGPYENYDQNDDEWYAAWKVLGTSGTGLDLNFGQHNTYRTGEDVSNTGIHYQYGFFLPTASVGIGITWGTQFKWYVSRADIAWHEDNPGAGFPNVPSQHVYDNDATYPNGWIGTWDMGAVTYSAGHTLPALSISFDNDSPVWIDEFGAQLLPFPDEGYDVDGVTANDASGYGPFPTIQKIDEGTGQGAWAMIWSHIPAPGSQNSTTGEYNKPRLFIWNPLDQTATQVTQIEGFTIDTVDDLGAAEAGRYSMNPWHTLWPIDFETEKFYKVGIQNGDAPIQEIHIANGGGVSIGGPGDVLPPYIIYQILTNPIFGMGCAESDIDTNSYVAALSYCQAEEILVSTEYKRESSKLNVIEELLALYGGYMTISGGKIKFGLMDTTQTPVRTIDNDRLVRNGDRPPVDITIAAKDDSFNKVIVNYIDRSLEYRQNQIEVNDEVDQDLRGVYKKEFPGRFVMSEQTATKIGLRSLWSNLYGKDQFAFNVSMKDSDLEAGDVVTLVDSFHPNHALSSGIDVRITRIREKKRGEIEIIAVTEVPYIATATDSPLGVGSSATGRDPIYGPSRIPANQTAYELPAEFSGSAPRVYVGYNALSSNRGAWLYASEDGTSYAQIANAEPFVISGILAAPLPARPDGYMEQNVDIFLFPDTRSGFTASSPVYVNTYALEDLSASGRQSGGATMIVGSEAMAYQGLTLIGQNHYRVQRLYRGWGGTHIQAHNSGAYWHKHGGGVFGLEYNEDRIGTTVSYKVVPYNFAGQGVQVESVNASTYTIGGAYFRPQIQGGINTFVHSVENGQNSVDLRGLQRVDVVAGGSAIDFTWPEAARLSGWGAQGYGTGDYGRFTQDITSPTYRVQILSSDLSTVVRCTTVSTGFFNYSVNANSADFNGWNGDFLFRMTPYNEYGDAPRSATKRMRAF